MTEEKFEKLISSEEGRLIDFKRTQYRLINGNSNDLAKFIKDIISFTNTIREESAYIILGIEDISGEKTFHGLDTHIDDAIFQDKIKDKVNPRPVFTYYSFLYQSRRYGIIEIPVEAYSAPITIVQNNLKGLDVGKIYFRRGSSNSEANGIEAININEWITSVVPPHNKAQINQAIISLISKISASEYFSPHISEALSIGKQLNHSDIVDFCVFELTGEHDEESYNIGYRSMDCFMSASKIMRANYPSGTPMSVLWNELREKEDFWESKFNLGDPINQIEAQLRNFRSGSQNQFISMERKAKHFLDNPSSPDLLINVYWGEQNMASIYERSKQKLIQLLTNAIN